MNRLVENVLTRLMEYKRSPAQIAQAIAWQEKGNPSSANKATKSKLEDELGKLLKKEGFKTQRHVVVGDVKFYIDFISEDEKIWVESDSDWHYKQIKPDQDLDRISIRDETEERVALENGILLIRVNNRDTSPEEQFDFIMNEIEKWDGERGRVVKLITSDM